jgi:hypothetical protein
MQAKLQGAIAMNKTKLVKISTEVGIDVSNKFKGHVYLYCLDVVW